jgi:protein-disulfide isomerase
LLAICCSLTAFVADVQQASADPAQDSAGTTFDTVLGRAEAKVTVEEYSSLGCPHCADFHVDVLPRIKAQYIDTGKVRWIVLDFPLGQLPLAGAVVARCAGPDHHLELLETLFKSQAQWMAGKDPIGNLERIAGQAGIGRARFDACLKDDALINGIMKKAQEAQKRHAVSATPTFIINGEKVEGSMPFGEFAGILERHAKKAAGQ